MFSSLLEFVKLRSVKILPLVKVLMIFAYVILFIDGIFNIYLSKKSYEVVASIHPSALFFTFALVLFIFIGWFMSTLLLVINKGNLYAEFKKIIISRIKHFKKYLILLFDTFIVLSLVSIFLSFSFEGNFLYKPLVLLFFILVGYVFFSAINRENY